MHGGYIANRTCANCIASFPGLALSLYYSRSIWEEERKNKREEGLVCIIIYRGVAMREVGEEGLGTRLQIAA